MTRVPLGSPRIEEDDIESVTRSLEKGILSTGEIVDEFEDAFSDFIGREHGIAVCSGSVALELALEASSLENGDKVLVSPFNCSAILYSLVRCGLEPVFVDIETKTYNISPRNAEEKLETENADGLLVTHLYGQPADMKGLMRIADSKDLVVIDDFAQSPGALYEGKKIGTYGDVGICSFGATKNITTAEGGMILTDDDEIANEVRITRSNTQGDYSKPLRSVRMNDIEASIGIQQLEKYDEILETKHRTAEIYRQELPDVLELPKEKSNRTHVYHGFPVLASERDSLMEFLEQKGIETAAVYDEPLHRYECASTSENFTNTEMVSDSVLLLPIHPCMSQEDANEVVSAVSDFYSKRSG